MTQLEFAEAIEFLNPSDNKDIQSFDLYDITYSFDGEKVILQGKIPRVIVQDIALTYPEFNTFINHLSPIDATKQFVDKLELYDLDELIVFTLFMEDYYLQKKTGLIGNSHQNYGEILSEIIKSLMGKLDPTINVDEWVRKNFAANELYFDTRVKIDKKPLIKTSKKMYEYEYTKNIKRNVDNFDLNVNPFSDKDNEFLDLDEMLKNIKISFNDLGDGALRLIIKSRKNNTVLIHERKNTGFSNSVTYKRGSETITFIHELTANNPKKITDGEKVIVIEQQGEDIQKRVCYNFSTNKIKINESNEKDATTEDKTIVYNETIGANALSSELVEECMLKKKAYGKRR